MKILFEKIMNSLRSPENPEFSEKCSVWESRIKACKYSYQILEIQDEIDSYLKNKKYSNKEPRIFDGGTNEYRLKDLKELIEVSIKYSNRR